MRHTSTWIVWLINKVCDFWRQRIHAWFMRRCFMHWGITMWVAIANNGLLGPIFLEETVNSERCIIMLRNTFCASLSSYRLAVTNLVVHAGRSQAARSECCFGLSAWHFRLACHLKPISWSFRMWTELTPKYSWFKPMWLLSLGIFPKKPLTITELRALIIQACNEITEDMCRPVINNITVRVEGVARFNGGHIERLIHRG
jgi:hypothetical protein